jgi:xylulokinase
MSKTDKVLIGVDLGTSAVKVVAFDVAGKALASASAAYPLLTPKPNWSEQHPEDWWQGTASALKKISKQIAPESVAGISFSGQMHGSVFLDRQNRVIRPALLWNDGRTAAECAQIVERVGEKEFLRVIKNLPLTSFTLPKLLWLKQHEAANFKRLDCVLLPKDYVRLRMTGRRALDAADGAGTVMMEVGKQRWATGILEMLGLDAAVLPELVDSSAVVGELTAEAARETGLRAGTPVAAGGGDQPVGAIGTGVVAEGQVMISLGTSGVVFAPTRQAHVAGAYGLASFDHAVPGVSYLMGCVMSAGGALQWYRNTLCAAEAARAKREKRDVYELLLSEAAQTPLGAEELLFMPYLMGERTPHANPDARGAFFGLSQRHTLPHFSRAVVEGVTFGLRDCLELVKAKGIRPREVRATGGGARGPFWRQVLADVFGLPVTPVESAEGPALGAALIAGVGVGVYRDFAAASRQAVRTGQPVKPIAKNVKAYDVVYARWRKLYPATEGLLIKH